MLTFIMSIMFSASINVSAPLSSCETYAPNLEGITVTVCDGEVLSRCDSTGYCQIAE